MQIKGSHDLLVQASPDVCRAAVLDLAGYPEWYPGVREAELLTSGDDGATARLVFKTGLPALSQIECVLKLEARGDDRLKPSTEGGELCIKGRGWTFAAEPGGGTRVGLELGAEMSVPGGFITEQLVKGMARHFLIEAPVTALQRRVETGEE